MQQGLRLGPGDCQHSMGFLRCWFCGSHPKLCSVVPLQSLDSWGNSEDADAPSKRPSTSDLSDTAFNDIRREGWLYYKQILTKKGKVRWGWGGDRWGSGPALSVSYTPSHSPGPERAGSGRAISGMEMSGQHALPREILQEPREEEADRAGVVVAGGSMDLIMLHLGVPQNHPRNSHCTQRGGARLG